LGYSFKNGSGTEGDEKDVKHHHGGVIEGQGSQGTNEAEPGDKKSNAVRFELDDLVPFVFDHLRIDGLFNFVVVNYP
jgi:hypothetical protein